MLSKFLCKIGFHRFEHYQEKLKMKDYRREEMIVPIRECKSCGLKQHHMMPTQNGMDFNWKPYNITKGIRI